MQKKILRLLLVACTPFVLGCVEEGKSDYRRDDAIQGENSEMENLIDDKRLAMRNEIIEYARNVDIDSGGKYPVSQIDISHIVEKYIRIGDSYENAKSILVGNGFSVYEYSVEDARNRKDIKISYRVGAQYKMNQGVFHRRDIRIFLGKSPESKEVDSVLAKVNLKTV